MKIVSSVIFGNGEIKKEWAEKQKFQLVFKTNCNSIEFFDEAQDANGLLVNQEKIDRKIINNLKKCVVIGRYGIGVDNVDLKVA
jgi:D-3-phosphoglycerate dehydrogenase / 2-oxoglutarate reductase